MLRISLPFRSRFINERGVLIHRGEYDDGSTALIFKTANGEQLIVPTVNLALYGEKPDEGNIFLKLYSESEGVFEEMYRLGLVGNAVRTLEIGPHQAKVAEVPLLRDFM